MKSPETKTPKTTSLATHTQKSTVDSMPPLSTATSSQARASELLFGTKPELVTCIMVRKVKRFLPLSFVYTARPSWSVLPMIEVGSFEMNGKLTVIEGNMIPGKVSE